jgi:two-component system, chemotaxis family, response regulator WspF
MRIAIVNDVKMIVEVLRRVLSKEPSYEIAWVAYNGAEAVEKCALDTPDLILMDLLMPVMGGVEATYAIMKNTPCAILIVTSSVSGNTSKVFEAMGYGALDVVNSPVLGRLDTHHGADEILKKIETIARLIGKAHRTLKKERAHPQAKFIAEEKEVPPLLLIGASTGGPIALAKIVSRLPEKIHLATVIIQHVDEQFAEGLAEWLGEQTSLSVQLAHNESTPTAGKILLAGQNHHLIMTRNLTLKYTVHPIDKPYRPSVDVFFHSVAQHWPQKSIAVLLTGMGKDGARGLKALHDAGWYTIAEHQKSCIVYGMPKAAIEIGAVTDVLPLEQIAPKILARLNAP